jgi:hypothetical protein
MKLITIIALTFLLTNGITAQDKEDSLMVRRIFDIALTQGQCYQVLEHLCTQIGPRLSGSPGAAKAVHYMESVMKSIDLDSVYLQEVMVPYWVRGEQCSAQMNYSGRDIHLNVCALGGSVSTPKEGIEAEVIEVQGLKELDDLGEAKLNGKIVFFNRPMDPRHIHTFEAYGGCVDQRWGGASKAAQHGAKAVIVRSMSLANDDYPHTGSMGYDTLYPQIPAMAVSTKGADLLHEQLKLQKGVRLYLKQDCGYRPDTLSHNVIGQLSGSTGNVLLAGGHLDAWDNGQGAHDDGAGCVHSIEALRILKEVGYVPKNTLRAVLFMNEENGLRGGKEYARLAELHNERHLAAIESDRGGFTPRGFFIDDARVERIASIARFKTLLEPYGLHDFRKGGGGADINPLKTGGTLCLGYIPDSQRYFDYHHAASDTFDKVNRRELELGAASIAAMLYLMDKYASELFPKTEKAP